MLDFFFFPSGARWNGHGPTGRQMGRKKNQACVGRQTINMHFHWVILIVKHSELMWTGSLSKRGGIFENPHSRSQQKLPQRKLEAKILETKLPLRFLELILLSYVKWSQIASKSLPYPAMKNRQKIGFYYEDSRKYPPIFGSHSLIIFKLWKQRNHRTS